MRCVPQVLDIRAKAKIMFRLTLSTTYEKRSVDIHLGDFIDGLIYQSGDNLKEVSGVVKSINTFERALPRSAYDSPDYISLRNIIESITLDISNKYNSELLTIDIEDIRNYDMVIHNTLDIRNIDIFEDTNTIRFYSETKPIAFVWNDKTFDINPVPTVDFMYEVNVDSMRMTNFLTIFDDSGCIFKRVIDGPNMDVVDEHDLKEDMKTVMMILHDQFFEKYNATNLTEIIGDIPYTPIIKNIGNIESFIANGITYYTNDLPSVDVIIPNRESDIIEDSIAVMQPFKIIDNNFCVCVPIICHFTDNEGVLNIEVNGYEQSWLLNPHKKTILDISNIKTINVPNGYIPNVIKQSNSDDEYVIIFDRKHMSTYPSITYGGPWTNKIDRGIMSIEFTEDGGWSYKYRLVNLDTIEDRERNESIYIPNVYIDNAPVTVNDVKQFNYNVFIFGEGYIKFNINFIDTKK